MAEPAAAADPDQRRALLIVALLAGVLLLVAALTLVFGLEALYLAAAIATPVYLVGIIQLSLDSSNPDHARVTLADEEQPPA